MENSRKNQDWELWHKLIVSDADFSVKAESLESCRNNKLNEIIDVKTKIIHNFGKSIYSNSIIRWPPLNAYATFNNGRS